MPRRREHNPSAPVVVGPTGDRFRSQTLVRQAIEILGLEQDVLMVLVVMNVMLLVVDDEVRDAPCNGMARIHHANFERPERWMANVGAAHHVAISWRR